MVYQTRSSQNASLCPMVHKSFKFVVSLVVSHKYSNPPYKVCTVHTSLSTNVDFNMALLCFMNLMTVLTKVVAVKSCSESREFQNIDSLLCKTAYCQYHFYLGINLCLEKDQVKIQVRIKLEFFPGSVNLDFFPHPA